MRRLRDVVREVDGAAAAAPVDQAGVPSQTARSARSSAISSGP